MQILKPFIGRILLLQFIYLIIRAVFYKNNMHLFENIPLQEVFMSFLIGLRFDLSAICILNSLYFILYLIPAGKWQKTKETILGIWFTLVNGAFIGLNIFDVEYYQFQGKRLTVSSFAIVSDIQAQVGQIAIHYWYFSLLIIACLAILWKGQNSFNQLRVKRQGLLPKAIFAFLGIILAGFLARGGWQLKPLLPAHAFLDNRPQLAILSLNSTFTILKSYKQKALQAKYYFNSWQEVQGALAKTPTLAKPAETILPPNTNVMVIVLESFNLEYMGYSNDWDGYTPFLDELAKKSYFFKFNIANGRRSIDAMPSIFAGIPAWMEIPYITSIYQNNHLSPLPHIFKNMGYETAFFHGGENGTMFFDVMAKIFGFENYYGAQEYPNPSDHDGHWGIYDEPFLSYTLETINKSTKPFFAGVFTLSSHQPYSIPAKYTGKFKKGKLDIHESIAYSDHALRKFFEQAKKEDWYEKTLFIITSDHTSKSEHPDFQGIVGDFRTPLLFFHPSIDLNLNTQQLSQQTDILPTVVDLFNLPSPKISHFGQSLLLDTNKHLVIKVGAQYYLLDQEGLRSYGDNGKEVDLSVLPWLPARQQDEIIRWDETLRAKVQYFHNGLIEDRLLW